MKAIITFHSIDTRGTLLSYPPGAFACLLAALEQSGLPVVSLDVLLNTATDKGVAITFDDGMRSVFTSALPVLREHAAPAHLYLATAAVGKNNRWPTQPRNAPGYDMLNWHEIEQLHDTGIRIESHTHSHPDMRKLDSGEMAEECDVADDLIEKRLGRRPQYFAYPYGYHDDRVRGFAGGRYKAAATTRLGTLSADTDPVKLPRLDSYYLQGHWLHKNLHGFPARAYLSFRSVLRTLRGTR